MHIHIDLTGDESSTHLNAIAMLVAALGGRAAPMALALAAEAGAPICANTMSPDPIMPELCPTPAAPLPPVVIPTPFVEDAIVSGSASPVLSLDAESLPWDGRIHSDPPKQTADGKWRRKRNTADDIWDSVRAELRKALAAPAPTVPVTNIPANSPLVAPYAIAPAAPTAAEAFGAVPLVPLPPVAPVVTASPVAAASNAPDDSFMKLVDDVLAAQNEGKLNPEQTQAVVTAMGLTGIRDIMLRPDLVPTARMMLGL